MLRLILLLQMTQIELEQSEQYIKQLKEQSEQEQLRIDNKVLVACLLQSHASRQSCCCFYVLYQLLYIPGLNVVPSYRTVWQRIQFHARLVDVVADTIYANC